MKTNPAVTEWLESTAASRSEMRSRSAVSAAIASASRMVAPLWPLENFVAVNPFLGISHLDFDAAARRMARVAGARMTMPRSFYAQAIQSGRIAPEDLAAALAEARGEGVPKSVRALEALALRESEPAEVLPTVADVARELTGSDWPRFIGERLSDWAAGYFDEHQASFASPFRDLTPYAAWRAEAVHDRAPELMGLPGFRRVVKSLPSSAEDAALSALERLDVPRSGLDEYLHRLLMSIAGWAGYARYLDWQVELGGEEGTSVAELMAVRLAWELALLESVPGVSARWEHASRQFGSCERSRLGGPKVDLILHAAYEKSWQRHLASRLGAATPLEPGGRPAVQAAFCIDVRSEVFRRALESVDPEVATLGFAGFFGFPIEYVPLGHDQGGARCPALLSPKFVVCEAVAEADEEVQARAASERRLRKRTREAWRSFKQSAVASFGFVETMGLLFAGKLVSDSLGMTRTVPHPQHDGLGKKTRRRIAPRVAQSIENGRLAGLSDEEQLAVAEAALRAMSLTENFARLILLVGHGSTTVNNPHAAGLDCGACGGHAGEANARVAAQVLNSGAVRQGLAARGILVPTDTVFLGALHDTTTDEVTLFDQDLVPASHRADVARIGERLAAASAGARAERARLLGIEGGCPHKAVVRRSRDWSQVRPEWGLAGCAAFIVAPRKRTAGLDLGGRSFLHSYEWRQDEGFNVLELIMTAPMVVTSWISLQYYGSTVDNRVFGSGNKVLHNVVGGLGVLEGNGGDLRVGLPWQSVNDGTQFVHEPVRLSVLIEAPVEAMNAIVAKHPKLRELLDNGWLHLFALDESGRVAHRYLGDLCWKALPTGKARLAAA